MGLFILIFIIALAVVGLIFFAASVTWNPEKRRIRKELRQMASDAPAGGAVDIIRRRDLSSVPLLNRILLGLKSPFIYRMDNLVLQAGSPYPLGFFVLLSFVLYMAGFLLGVMLTRYIFIPVLLSLVMGAAPFYYLRARKARRLNRLQGQLPDALDMVSRALKAGHALTGGFNMVAQEFQDPIRSEFQKVLDEINFGVSYEDALRNLNARIDSPDVKFLSMSVIIQKQSGGNLAEILESISSLIRERLKLQGRIRVLSAEAKLSAVVLIVLPFVIALAMALINPRYLPTMLNDPIGHLLLGISFVMMMLGIFCIRRMIAIKV